MPKCRRRRSLSDSALAIHTSRCIAARTVPLVRSMTSSVRRAWISQSKPGFVINEAEYPLPVVEGEQRTKTGGTLLSWQKPG